MSWLTKFRNALFGAAIQATFDTNVLNDTVAEVKKKIARQHSGAAEKELQYQGVDALAEYIRSKIPGALPPAA